MRALLAALERRSLVSKLALGFGSLLVLAALMGAFALRAQFVLSAQMQQVYEDELLGVAVAKDMQIHFASIGRMLGQALLASSTERRSQNLEQVAYFERQMQQELEWLRPRLFRSEAKVALDRFVSEFGRYKDHVDAAIGLIQQGRPEEAMRFVSSEAFRDSEAVASSAIASIIHIKEEGTRQETETARRLAADTMRVTAVLLVATFGAGAWLAWLIALSIRRPAEHIRVAVESLAQGDLDITVPHAEFTNEVGTMARAVQVLQSGVQAARLADEAVRAAKEVAEEATRAKSEFLANMSHEIRTPMNAIIGMSHLALQTNLDKRQRNYIEKVHRSGENLLGIINDILDFSKIEAGKMGLETIAFRLEDVMDNLANLVGLKAEDKGLELLFRIGADVPTALLGDPLRLGQVLINLGNNAAKFTEKGEIVVGVETVGQDAAGVELHFWVQDSGIGMTAEQCARLFQSFSQADASTTSKYGGTGLGLAISKNLVEAMQGRIWVESVPNQGSTFHFHARFGVQAQPMALAEKADQASDAMARLGGARILLVEDNDMNQELAMELLQAAGVEVVLARHGQEALDTLAQDTRFDGVLMDCQMPVMDGYAATRAIRQNPAFEALPIIAMTANAMAGDREKVLEAGMNDHIAKPLNVGLMFATLARWVRPLSATKVRAFHAISTSPGGQNNAQSPGDAGWADLPGIDMRTGRVAALNDDRLYTRMLVKFRDGQGDFARLFAAARQDADATAPTRAAHTLKGTAGNIGARAVQAAAAELEAACQCGAAPEVIDRLLALTLAQLAPVIEGLRGISEGAPPPRQPSGHAGADPAAVLAAVQRLQGLLQDSDAEALEAMDALVELAQGTPWAVTLPRVAAALAAFDFDGALAALQHGGT